MEYTSAEAALQHIQSGQRVFIHGSACTPVYMLQQLALQAERLQNVELVSISLYGDAVLDKAQYSPHFHFNSLFVSGSIREAVNAGRADYVPIFLSEIPELFKRGILPLDVAMVQVSPPDKHGYCSLGPSVDIARSAVNNARKIIAQVNPCVPRVHGDGVIHQSSFAAMVWQETPLQEVQFGGDISPEEHTIGRLIADMIPDGSTLQMGIGALPDAVLHCLGGHKDLGVHSEMFSDGLLELMQKGVINNRFKNIHPGKTVGSFAVGSRKLYDFIDDNPAVVLLDMDYVNEPTVICRNKKVVAINSAIEVDITGQVCADSIGTKQFSGVGGQMDFMRGAAMSEDGLPIIALTSRTTKGIPRIVPMLKPGAGVVTTRAHVHHVVTEYGAVNLFGKNLRERAKALISIAHPDDREALERSCRERFVQF